jgi:hypothetical protein
MSNITLTQINELLQRKKNSLTDLEDVSERSREKLRLINKQINSQEEELLNIIMYITESEQDVSTLDTKNVLNSPNELNKRINKVLDNLRKIRNSLADIIRGG